MDDFIKILIWAIIIISFFSTIFKKKNKLKTSQNAQQDPNSGADIPKRVEPQRRTVENKEEIDSYNVMLSEFENLFKKDAGSGKSISEEISQSDIPRTKISDKTKIDELEEKKRIIQYDSQWHKETASEHTLVDNWEQEEKSMEKKAAVDFNIENKAKKFEELINQKPEPIGIFKHTIKEKLRHPATLKDYILMSEIIGKPKAKKR